MSGVLQDSLTRNWPRKLIAFASAIIIWFMVNNAITTTKTFVNVPVRIMNLPSDQTVIGLLPSGILSKRINLTLSGTRKVLDNLDPGDIEVLIDASDKTEQWVAEITRKNVVLAATGESLDPHLTDVVHSPLILRMSRLIQARVSVRITPPQGEPPRGYQLLNIWPRWLLHTVKGPEEQVEELQAQGLQLTFDLGDIAKEELDRLDPSNPQFAADEVNYLVPASWKRVPIPFNNNALEDINDIDADKLRIEFLRKDLLPLDRELAIQVYYPPRYSSEINPELYNLQENGLITRASGIPVLRSPLYMKNASRLFLDVVRDHLQIVIIAQPETGRSLPWSVQVIDPDSLEETYVELLAPVAPSESDPAGPIQTPANHLRERFREYLRQFQLVKADGSPLQLDVRVKDKHIVIQEAQ